MSFEEALGHIFRMGPYYFVLVLVAGFYSIIQTGAFQNRSIPSQSLSSFSYYLAILFACIIRMCLAYYEYGNVDVTNFITTAEITYSGKLVYEHVDYVYNYIPSIHLGFLVLAKWLSVTLNLPLHFLIKIPAILTDILCVLLIYLLPLKPAQERLRVSLLLVYSPVMMAVSTVLGQFDVIPTLLIFVAYVLLVHKQRWKLSAVCLGLAISSKTFPVIFLPAFVAAFSDKKRICAFVGIVLIPILVPLFVALSLSFDAVLQRVILYRGIVGGSWGISGIFWYFEMLSRLLLPGQMIQDGFHFLWQSYNAYGRFVLYLYLIVAYFTVFRKVSLLDRIVLTILGFYVFSNAVAPQYLVWLLPFYFFGNYSFAPTFHFLCVVWIGIYTPAVVEGPLHIDKFPGAYRIVGTFLWAHTVYALVHIMKQKKENNVTEFA